MLFRVRGIPVKKRGGSMKPATILDVGSSKVVCLCGSMVDKDGIVVHGAGISTYAGFRDGVNKKTFKSYSVALK